MKTAESIDSVVEQVLEYFVPEPATGYGRILNLYAACKKF